MDSEELGQETGEQEAQDAQRTDGSPAGMMTQERCWVGHHL